MVSTVAEGDWEGNARWKRFPCWLLWMYIMQEVLLFMHLNYDCWMRLVLCQIINVILHVHTLLKGSIDGCSLDVGMSLIYYTWIFMSYIFGFNEILRMISNTEFISSYKKWIAVRQNLVESWCKMLSRIRMLLQRYLKDDVKADDPSLSSS